MSDGDVERLERGEQRRADREDAGVVAVVRLQSLADRDDPVALGRDAGDVERIDPGVAEPAIDAEPSGPRPAPACAMRA